MTFCDTCTHCDHHTPERYSWWEGVRWVWCVACERLTIHVIEVVRL